MKISSHLIAVAWLIEKYSLGTFDQLIHGGHRAPTLVWSWRAPSAKRVDGGWVAAVTSATKL
jgi:hypothetical protein